MMEAQPIRFADYDLVRMLGRGGMGEVWSAVKRWQLGDRKIAIGQELQLDDSKLVADHRAINKPLAVKVMHPSLSEDEEYRRMWAGESSITMQFSSANIVSVFEVGEHEGLLYMAMERIDGVNLHDFHQRVLTLGGLMPLDVTVRIIHEILAALFVAHEHTMAGRPSGIIHRDVKPGNVLISSVGDIRLTDFGIARPVSDRMDLGSAPGTPRYMAPEQARGFASKASDLFAVGAIFQELLTGRRFRDECRTTEALLSTPYSIPLLDRQIPTELEYLRRGLLHPDPAQRIGSAREALSLIPTNHGHARLKTAELYEKAVGMRSSGFTRNHLAAIPSFLVQRRVGFESALTNPLLRTIHSRAESKPSPPAEPSDDDETLTYERMPWLSEPSRSSRSGPETNAPRRRHPDREVLRQHRAAPGPRSHTKPDHAGRQRKATITPTEILASALSSTSGVIDSSHVERTELQASPHHGPTTPLPPPTMTSAPVSQAESRAAPSPETPVASTQSAPPVRAHAQRASSAPRGSAARTLTFVVIAAAMFAAGIATALIIQRAPKTDAPNSETRP